MDTPANLSHIVRRSTPVQPWHNADCIPWNDPAFSARMLREHLSQSHDQASRRTEKIESHVAWIHTHLLRSRPTRILDLGCGPGLFAERLAGQGHHVTGVDFNPASIAYASSGLAKRTADASIERTICEPHCSEVDSGS